MQPFLLIALFCPFFPIQVYAFIALGIVAFHVVSGILVSGGGVRDLVGLTAVPFYIFWKLVMSASIAEGGKKKTQNGIEQIEIHPVSERETGLG